jgi:hypothetical protein
MDTGRSKSGASRILFSNEQENLHASAKGIGPPLQGNGQGQKRQGPFKRKTTSINLLNFDY